jgi:hypothetical protein
MRRRLFVACILAGLMAFVIQPAFAQTETLVGSWQLTLVANVPPTQPSIPVAGLANFTSDGGAIATAAGILVGPVTPSSSTSPTTPLNPAFGNWNGCCQPISGENALSLVSLITNSDGTLFATRVFNAIVTVTSGTFSGTYSFTVTNSAGTVISTGSGTINGTLIPHFLPPGSSE